MFHVSCHIPVKDTGFTCNHIECLYKILERAQVQDSYHSTGTFMIIAATTPPPPPPPTQDGGQRKRYAQPDAPYGVLFADMLMVIVEAWA